MAVPAERSSLRRYQLAVMAVLAVLALAAWAVLVAQAHLMSGMSTGLTMGMDVGFFLAIWIAMMAAMMFPAAAPMVLTFVRVQASKRRKGLPVTPAWLFVCSYLAVWALVGVLAYAAAIGAEALGRAVPWVGVNGPRLGGVLLVTAGLYQFTPLKHVCLRQCRSPLTFIVTSWRDGIAGALHMGVTHGLYCLGCCWLLFAILFPLGMMNIILLAAVTSLIFAEKSLPYGDRLSWAVAVPLIGYGVAVLVSPTILPMQPPHSVMS